MALKDGFPSASGVADANDIRLGLAGLVVRDTSGNPRTGVFPRHGNALVNPTATMNSAVSAFDSCVSRSGQGVIFLANDGVVNVLHGNAPAANSRYDIVYVKQNDAVAPNADANSLPVFGTLALAASPSPTLPTFASAKAALDVAPGVLPGAEPLAAVLIPSTATTMQSSGVVYTQLHQYTATSGGIVWFRTKAELDLWTAAPPFQKAIVMADGVEYRRVGSAWIVDVRIRHIAIATGTVASGTVLGTFTVPRRAFVQRVVVDMSGYIAPVGAVGNVGVALAATAGGTAVNNPAIIVTVANGTIGQYARKGIFDIAAGAGADVSITLALTVATTATSAQVGLTATATTYVDGEY